MLVSLREKTRVSLVKKLGPLKEESEGPQGGDGVFFL
jgi:hypothetical protein